MKDKFTAALSSRYDVLVHFANSMFAESYAACGDYVDGAQFRVRKPLIVTCLRCLGAPR